MTQSFDCAIAAFAPRLPLAIGFSGGADSTALLLACSRRWPGQVHALHVHHGLQAAADGFEQHCRHWCAQHRIPLAVARVDARHGPGQSPEDAARQARYKALTALLAQTPSRIHTIALAQHADDQVETLLLALSRGAGVAGLAAMPQRWQRDGVDWQRPLLKVAGEDVRSWLTMQGVGWIDDPTNLDQRYTRNRIRHCLLPVLNQVFPHFRDTFVRSSTNAAQANELLEDLAQADLLTVGVPPRIQQLQALSHARQANVLRYWLRCCHSSTATAAQLSELLHQVFVCRTRGHRIRIKVGHGYVLREGDVLGWYNSQVLDSISARDGGAPKQHFP